MKPTAIQCGSMNSSTNAESDSNCSSCDIRARESRCYHLSYQANSSSPLNVSSCIQQLNEIPRMFAFHPRPWTSIAEVKCP